MLIPLSKETLNDATSLIYRIFIYKPDQELARKSLTESLSRTDSGKNYWVVTDPHGKVIGITGLYVDHKDRKDKTTVWLGWFGVHPDYRRRGIGSSLLEVTIREARRRGFRTLKLYTSLDKSERAAHKLYEVHGFKKTSFSRSTEPVYYSKDLAELPTKTRKKRMTTHEIPIEWEGPFDVEKVIKKMDDEGKPPDYGGEDYGLYQIYGTYILCGSDTLLYIGKATQQTFSRRFREHKKWWLDDEEEIQVYLGRVYDPKSHTEEDNWKSWERDICLAENILIYKYSPNYNNTGIGDRPSLTPFEKVTLVHNGKRHRIEVTDNAPQDYS